MSALIAMGLGYPFFRLRGHYFVIATIVIAEIGCCCSSNWEWAGAAMGITIPIRGDSWLKFQFLRTQAAVLLFRAGAVLPRLVRRPGGWKTPNGVLGGAR